MSVALLTHPICSRHETGRGHPERGARVGAVRDALLAASWAHALAEVEAPRAQRAALLRAHDEAYVDAIRRRAPQEGTVQLDADTVMGPHSLEASLHAAGAAIHAVDLVLDGVHEAAFCGVRPPGHHAERGRAMGFCLFDNIAIAALHALDARGLARVAIVDFDVHHGNGTEDILGNDARVLFCSSFQHPLYPYSGADTSSDHVRNVPLPAGTDGAGFRAAVAPAWFEALDAFRPELVLFSAGFDAHARDPLANLNLFEEDYAWITREVLAIADVHAGGRSVSTLEGGYDLEALGASAAAHVGALARA